MMVVEDSGDYELMPKQELDDIRREVSALKKNSMSEGDKAKVLIESMDRLTISINRLITILDDAQKDIIDEYQQAKPTEKLSQIVEQNEVIAKALLALHGNLEKTNLVTMPQSPNAQVPSLNPQVASLNPQASNQRNVLQRNDLMQQQQSNQSNPFSSNPFSQPQTPMEEFPPMQDLPPLDNPTPTTPKKKFLGIM